MKTIKHEDNLERARFLESERIFLTPLSIEDAEYHYYMENDRELALLDGGDFRPHTLTGLREDIEGTAKQKDLMFFSIILKESGENIGNIVLYRILEYHRRANWGIKLRKPFWRLGYGTEAARLLIRYAFEDLGLQRLKCDTNEKNVASIRFQESLGFVREGCMRRERYVQGEYLDDVLYGMLRSEYLESSLFKDS